MMCTNPWCEETIKGDGHSEEETVSGRFCSVACLEAAIEAISEEDHYWNGSSGMSDLI
jgi:hypothetical protein